MRNYNEILRKDVIILTFTKTRASPSFSRRYIFSKNHMAPTPHPPTSHSLLSVKEENCVDRKFRILAEKRKFTFCKHKLLQITSFENYVNINFREWSVLNKFWKHKLLWVMSFVLEILKLKKRKLWCIRIILFFGRCYSFDSTGYYNCYFYSIIINVYNL